MSQTVLLSVASVIYKTPARKFLVILKTWLAGPGVFLFRIGAKLCYSPPGTEFDNPRSSIL